MPQNLKSALAQANTDLAHLIAAGNAEEIAKHPAFIKLQDAMAKIGGRGSEAAHNGGCANISCSAPLGKQGQISNPAP